MFDPNRAPPSPRPEPFAKVPPATLALALLLTAIVAILHLLPEATMQRLVVLFAFRPAGFLAFLRGQHERLDLVWGVVTHAFVHLDWLHLAVNAGFLMAFGSVVERTAGPVTLILGFLLSAVAGALTQALLLPSDALGEILIGASGGVYGLMGMAIPIAFRRAPATSRLVLTLVALNLFVGLLSEVGLTGGYRIGWQAHLGGLAAGLAYGWLLRRHPPRR